MGLGFGMTLMAHILKLYLTKIFLVLLIEKRMDGFSVMEARDASLNIGDGMPNLDEARMKVYRQIWQYQQRGWLRTEGEGRNKRYF